MKPYKERNDEPATKWQPSLKEAKELEEELKMFKLTKIGNRLIPPFLLWCQKKDYISFDEFGSAQVKNPFAYTRAIETNGLREWHNAKELEHVFASFPEEKAAYDQKIKEMISDWRTQPV